MKVLHIASGDFFSTYGGGQVYVKNIVDTMIDMGIDLSVVSTTDTAGPITKNYRGSTLVEIPGGISDEQLLNVVEGLKPNVIHAHSLKDRVCRVGRKLGIPVVVTAHHGGILCPAGTRLDCADNICSRKISHQDCLPCVMRNIPGAKWLWHPMMKHLPEKNYDALGRWLSNKPFIPFITPVGSSSQYIKKKQKQWHDITEGCTRMIAPCKEIADAMIANGLAAHKVSVIPHGIPMPAQRPAFPAIIDGKIKFYYVGRICYVKGIHILLEAFHSVDAPGIELHLIGGAGNKHEVRYMNGLQKRYFPDKRIIWHGKIAPEAIYDATRNYHVSSSSAFLEAFGLNIAEALALGKPVLATRSGGSEQQIKDGVNGWLVPSNDTDALATKIRHIIAHADELPDISANCQAIPIRTHCEELLKTYHSVKNQQTAESNL